MRARHGVPPLTWDERVAQVAYEHSKDMAENNFLRTNPQQPAIYKNGLQKQTFHLKSQEKTLRQNILMHLLLSKRG